MRDVQFVFVFFFFNTVAYHLDGDRVPPVKNRTGLRSKNRSPPKLTKEPHEKRSVFVFD